MNNREKLAMKEYFPVNLAQVNTSLLQYFRRFIHHTFQPATIVMHIIRTSQFGKEVGESAMVMLRLLTRYR